MQWKISFIVNGNKLDKTLALVHALRPENLGVNPVTEEVRGSYQQAILKVLKGEMTVAMVAAAVGGEKNGVNTVLAKMASQKLIRRTSKGVYGPMRKKS